MAFRFKQNNKKQLTNRNKNNNFKAYNNVPIKKVELSDLEKQRLVDEVDQFMGFDRSLDTTEKLGWLVNMQPALIKDQEYPEGRSGVDLYFITETEESFKTTFLFKPYFFILCKDDTHREVEDHLLRRFPVLIDSSKIMIKEDLALPNHLAGAQRKVIKLVFKNMADLTSVKRFVQPIAQNNESKAEVNDVYSYNMSSSKNSTNQSRNRNKDPSDTAFKNIIGIREYDIPYLCRVAIDVDLRVGLWYNVKLNKESENELVIKHRPDLIKRADPVVLAFDIETTKLPLKFPDATFDTIMMISYMIDGQGYLITNREVISENINDFSYITETGLGGDFEIFNMPDEKEVILKFFEHIRERKPTVIATYNGDFFDWPFVEKRAQFHGIDMFPEIGFKQDEDDEYKSNYCIHMDCLSWVKRDSYLPAGSHGLKAVTKAKLGYQPVELDPEDMTRAAREEPQTLAEYSVSDAVATYYLYMKYVHPFIFSLCNIIPTLPDDVLRKGSGTLCEYLLMVEAFKANVLMPNKHIEAHGKLFNGHLVESETYVGGHVEALEAGVFRSDIPVYFNVQSKGIDTLISQLNDALKFSLKVEGNIDFDQVENYDEVYNTIKEKLLSLKSDGPILMTPLIYHLDVAAMYPNIILTNRLQPDAMIDEATCASCDFNTPDKVCDRKMTWSWRGEYYPATRSDLNMLRNQLSIETFPAKGSDAGIRTFDMLSEAEQKDLIKQRLKLYCSKVYRKVKESKVVERTSTVCQRENPFYIDTVRNFRDRRYEYKGLHKKWKSNLDKAIKDNDATQIEEAKKLIVVYDSLQLAHKCILNSFYGYVMRKGSRWYSMEMGGIVCLTGAKIIQLARQLVEQIGRPLELDTDGIWCILPSPFPENFSFKLKNGKKFSISYPCTMLNHLVHDQFTNDQYHDLVEPTTKEYSVKAENSIFFEVDGPYRAMILPASKEADKLLKKRYAVFNDDGSLAELKGFEIKRRGELKLIKIFQSQIFSQFLKGSNLKECYDEVAVVANQWLNILFNKGETLQDAELFELIAENRSMSKPLSEYGEQKSTSISTAKRLAEFLGDNMVKDKGLACQFIVSKLPLGLPVSERAIPTAIFFEKDENIKLHFLKKWTKDNNLVHVELRNILDWDYYVERFGSVIQKLITIPAAMQKVPNPIPRVPHPDWLAKRIASTTDKFQQRRITDIFQVINKENEMEDFGKFSKSGEVSRKIAKVTALKKRKEPTTNEALQLLLQEEAPPIDGDYANWLEYQRKKWKLTRTLKQENKKQANLSNSNQVIHNTNSKLSGFYKMGMPYLYSPFHVLQITPTDSLGHFKLWILINSQIHSLKLKVDRTIYINGKSKSQIDMNTLSNDLPIKVNNSKDKLPRSYTAYNLQSLKMNEQFYQENYDDFTNLFSHHNLEGAYETKLPLLNRAIIDIGCISSISGIGKAVPQYFSLDHFFREETTQGYYLNNVELNYLVLLHETQGLRHIITIFSTTMSSALVLVVDGPKKPTSQLGNLKNAYKKFYDFSNNGLPNNHLKYPAEISFEINFFDSPDKAWSAVNKFLINYQAKKLGPTLIAIHSSKQNELNQMVKAINDFPIINIPYCDQNIEMPPLLWQPHLFNVMLGQLFGLSSWLEEQISWSNYSNIPLCNISRDPPLFIADITFARQLKKNQQLLWWSSTDLPDLGGKEYDDSRYLVDNDMTLPNINFPNAYPSICFEVNIEYLAVNSILNCHLIDELEGLVGSGKSYHQLTTFKQLGSEDIVNESETFISDPSSINSNILDTLKYIVQLWCNDLVSQESQYAEQMVKHFYRWVTSNSSNLYDIKLHILINYLMKKVFAQLLSAIKSTSAIIIHATPQRLVIGTNKISYQNGLAFADYVIDTVLSKPLFRNLGLNVTMFWDRLFWYNPSNFGGIIMNSNSNNKEINRNIINNLITQSHVNNIDQESFYWIKEVQMSWSISHYLPSFVKAYFDMVIGKFLFDLHKVRRNLNNNTSLDQSIELVNKEEVTEGKRIFEEVLGPKLMDLIPDLKSTISSINDDKESLEFPCLPGSPYYFNNQNIELCPTLEWVKSIFVVLELDNRFRIEIEKLKTQSLSLLNINPFDPIVQFQMPNNCVTQSNNSNELDSVNNERAKSNMRSLQKDKSHKEASLKLPRVICKYCNCGWEIDFFEHLLLTRAKKMEDKIDDDENFEVGNILDSSMEFENNDDMDEEGQQFINKREKLNKIIESDDDLLSIQLEGFEGLLCPSCSFIYPPTLVEETLMMQLKHHITAFQLQDVECPKCDLMPTSQLPSQCESCIIDLENIQYSKVNIKNYCENLLTLARLYSMSRLEVMVNFFLEY